MIWAKSSKVKPYQSSEQAVFGLPVGVSVNPIETRYGVHIVEVLSREDGQALSFEQAMPMIANELIQQSFSSWFDGLFVQT